MIPAKKTIKASFVFWLSLMLLVAMPLVAAAAPVTEPATPPAQIEEGAVEPQWVPSGSHPGFYAARDNADLDADDYGLVGSHQTFYWDQLEPNEDDYRWEIIQAFLNRSTSGGKRAAIQIVTFNSRQNIGNSADPPIRVPGWVFQAGATKMTMSDGFEIPKFWNAVYKAKYRDFVADLAAQFDGNPALEYIQLGVGKYGETQPCDTNDKNAVIAAIKADGLNEWDTWWQTVNEIVDMYGNSFSQTRILLLSAPNLRGRSERKMWHQHAVDRGDIGLMPAGIYPDLDDLDRRGAGDADCPYCGKYDYILDQVDANGTGFPVSYEIYDYMVGGWEATQNEPDPDLFFWAVAGALSRRVDYLTAERNVLYKNWEANKPPYLENIEVIRWANKYMGRRMSNTPSVWLLMRETGLNPANRFLWPQKGNYNFGLRQINEQDSVAATYRTADDLVNDIGGDTQFVNPAVETEQAFLLSSRYGFSENLPDFEGWICRRTNQSGGKPNMIFDVDDNYINGGTNEVAVSVIYLDRGTDSWRLVYDAASDANKVAGVVTKENTGKWRKKVFALTDARFANSQSGADFRVESMDSGNEYIQMVDVKKGGASQDSFSVNLTTNRGGWNLVSVPLAPASTSVANFLSSISGKYDLVQAFYGGNWHSYPSGDLATVDQKMGLWIHVTQNCTLTVEGTAPASTTIALTSSSSGWNLMGWPTGGARSVSTALSSIAGKYDKIYTYDAYDATDPWKIYDVSAPSYVNDLTQLVPGKAYWIHMTSSADLVVSY